MMKDVSLPTTKNNLPDFEVGYSLIETLCNIPICIWYSTTHPNVSLYMQEYILSR